MLLTASITGILRKSNTAVKNKNSCQIPKCGVMSFGWKSFQGMIAPKYTNMLELRSRSKIVGK